MDGNKQDYLMDFVEAEALLSDPDRVLVSIPRWPELIDETSDNNDFGKEGEVPAAVWENFGTGAFNLRHSRTPDNTVRGTKKLQQIGIPRE